jgi:phage-related protein
MLKKFGQSLPEPHAKHLGNGNYELRFKGREGQIKVLHFFYNERKIIFTNGFVKKSNRVPKKEVELAIQRRNIYLNRNQ